MRNEILQIIMKPVPERGLSEEAKVLGFWLNCTTQEFRYAMRLKHIFKI